MSFELPKTTENEEKFDRITSRLDAVVKFFAGHLKKFQEKPIVAERHGPETEAILAKYANGWVTEPMFAIRKVFGLCKDPISDRAAARHAFRREHPEFEDVEDSDVDEAIRKATRAVNAFGVGSPNPADGLCMHLDRWENGACKGCGLKSDGTKPKPKTIAEKLTKAKKSSITARVALSKRSELYALKVMNGDEYALAEWRGWIDRQETRYADEDWLFIINYIRLTIVRDYDPKPVRSEAVESARAFAAKYLGYTKAKEAPVQSTQPMIFRSDVVPIPKGAL
jgi:hypothetical protein